MTEMTFLTANTVHGTSQNFLYYYKHNLIDKHQFTQSSTSNHIFLSKTYSLLSKSNFDRENPSNTQTTPLPRAHQYNPIKILLQKPFTGIQESFYRLKSIKRT